MISSSSPIQRPQQTRRLLPALLLAQVLALLIAATGVFSEALSHQGVSLPTTQSALNYGLLGLVYGCWLLQRKGGLRAALWQYALLAFLDVEGNFCLVLAYRYTSITSVTLLDSLTIPGVMLLSWLFLRAKYRAKHCLGAAICVAGVALLVITDSWQASSAEMQHPLAGDALVVLGATFYAICNVLQEVMLGSSGRVELLAMMGVFGALISAVQLVLVERQQLTQAAWSWEAVACFAGFDAAMFSFYSLVPFVLQWSGVAVLNLSLLSSDLWAGAARAILFGGFDALAAGFFCAAVVTVAGGLIVYTFGGDPYSRSRSSPSDKRRQSGEASEHLEEGMPMMLTLPGSSVLSPAELGEDPWGSPRADAVPPAS
ncbi:hypothetical protein WJX84_007778 [Apatococcus fuscideae]|uniref:Solute carrier family 35 member F2 n=1 Tax=Apatococcus fuscideae TaxID=2026836 RepID=A0AAW1SSP4_9CHLO